LDKLLGATVHIVTSGAERQAKVDEVAADLSDEGGVPYAIPVGGSNGIGALGYVAGMLELAEQLWRADVAPKAMYFAAGSGGTQGGIVLGAQTHGLDFALNGVLVEGKSADGIDRAVEVGGWAAAELGVGAPPRERYLADDGHVGEGYGIPTKEGIEAIQLLARTEAVLLDPVYTSKAFAGMVADIRGGVYSPDDSVIFLHTGGSPALFAQRDLLQAALS
ncbi:MAG TPA: D-cysteine desulfhydrase family protein, partial [Chloroflexi bacterium]|nr:D-cysteine desulfhydrase family protein [Chloroflexota bacterium]